MNFYIRLFCTIAATAGKIVVCSHSLAHYSNSLTVIIYTIVTMKNRLALAIALMVGIFSFLNLSSGGGGAYYDHGLTNEFEQVILDRRNLRTAPRPHVVDNTPDDYKELRIPEWLSSDAGRKLSDNKSFPNGDSSGVTGIVGADTADSQTPL